jgi:hypothetical protein
LPQPGKSKAGILEFRELKEIIYLRVSLLFISHHQITLSVCSLSLYLSNDLILLNSNVLVLISQMADFSHHGSIRISTVSEFLALKECIHRNSSFSIFLNFFSVQIVTTRSVPPSGR